ncbi:50S ribosomal protein L18e [Candidatus Pacearchaeota archaeon]|nr:50S ribosomal protein L18e [Candidatus Pacearchaeota archaeon]
MKSKTKISKQTKKKTNPEIVNTIIAAKKQKAWVEVAGIISGPRRKQIIINLDYLNKNVKEGDTIAMPGKVLGQGEIKKKIRIAALDFSESAREKLLKSRCEIVPLIEEIKKNPSAKGVKIIK